MLYEVITNTWQSCDWSFRRGHLFLTPGDSPVGLRLPLDALPWEARITSYNVCYTKLLRWMSSKGLSSSVCRGSRLVARTSMTRDVMSARSMLRPMRRNS